MKKTLVAIAALMISVAASYGQGAVVFNNRVGTEVNAAVTKDASFGADAGKGPGAGYTAQLYLVGAGGALTALTPSTTFRTASAAAEFFVNSVDVTVPGIAPGANATFRMRVWNTDAASYDSALRFGESANFTTAVGGGTLPPTNLVGLQAFTIRNVPEPTTIALGLLGLGAIWMRRRK
jgi:hypothetical protein